MKKQMPCTARNKRVRGVKALAAMQFSPLQPRSVSRINSIKLNSATQQEKSSQQLQKTNNFSTISHQTDNIKTRTFLSNIHRN